ncbi:MAG: HK97 family phage prohead protease [Firmicutes bacterium]|nr:HK97 family phage prohead protease [Bacillota bacterium]
MNKEIRLSELRLNNENEEMVLEGYAIVFNKETVIGDEKRGFIELIDRNALLLTNMKDVPLKYNHQDNFLVIARTRNESLTLEVDDVGLKVRAKLLDTASNQDIYKMVQNRLLDKMSFAFSVKEQSWDRSGEIPKRTIKSIERLYDVSIVDTPAYEDTSIYARSLDTMDMELDALDKEEINRKTNLVRKRLNIKLKGTLTL